MSYLYVGRCSIGGGLKVVLGVVLHLFFVELHLLLGLRLGPLVVELGLTLEAGVRRRVGIVWGVLHISQATIHIGWGVLHTSRATNHS